jgi:hypothetical protein
MTAFTRVVIVLSFVRTGIGSMQTPPTQVIVGIALFLTMFTMAPVTDKVIEEAYKPYAAGDIKEDVAYERAATPIRSFMLRQTREADLACTLIVDVEDDAPRALGARALDFGQARAVAAPVHRRPLGEGALRYHPREGGLVHEVVLTPVPFVGAGRAGGVRDAELELGEVAAQPIAQRRLACA